LNGFNPELELVTGVQALTRVALEWQRRDRRDGCRTAMLISGYQGSPLGGLDLEFQRNAPALAALDIVLRPGLNEELAATALWGSQLAAGFPGARFEGVSGMWYGKSPGLDRAADAIRHGNYIGVGARGGVVLAVGDDPSCKSSSLPSASESTLAALNVPTLYPGSVQDVLELGMHAFACSRAAGTWVAIKMTTDVADGLATVRPAPITPVLPRGDAHQPNGRILAPDSLEMERSLFTVRLPAAEEYAAVNSLNQIAGAQHDACLGIVAAGKTYVDLLQALRDLGVTDADLEQLGIRLLKIGMVFPLERTIVERFAAGLDEIVVLEEKQSFLELAVRQILYGGPHRPSIRAKSELPGHGELDQDALALELATVIGARAGVDRFRTRLDEIRAATSSTPFLATPARSPFFCSGCPHNRSTVARDDALVGAGIGCHSLVLLSPERRGTINAMTQMGGEGAQWIGISPFIDATHLVQNVGDGTFHHSGSLALRAAVAAGLNVTYKLLYNSAVAMTGGQSVEGGLTVSALTRLLEAEGVSRTIVTTEDLARSRGTSLASNATVRSRDELDQAQAELRETPGVTVLLHDQQCAIEKRRAKRRSGDTRKLRVIIDERVCEGCGDCSRKSNCLSVVPVETEFGRKTRIHQPSCSEDLSCLLGDCPSFVTIEAGPAEPAEVPALPPLPLPHLVGLEGELRIRIVGIGGTGTVTLGRIVASAASSAGYCVTGLDQTGLSQKGGAVVTDLLLQSEPRPAAARASAASVDLYLALDVVGAASPRYLAATSRERTRAAMSTTVTATAASVADPSAGLPSLDQATAQIDRSTRRAENIYVDAGRLSERLFDDHLPANLIVLGAAWQAGAIPLSYQALAQAITSARVDIEKNLLAFEWGRAAVAAPAAVRSLLAEPEAATEPPGAAELALVDAAGLSGELRRLVEIRAADLSGYQDIAYAATYVDFVTEIADWEAATFKSSELAEVVARHLHKLMAYKDEYEVARLHLLAWERGATRHGRVRWHLHPPLLRAFGLKRKIRVGPWIVPGFRLLRALRRIRGTRLDVFGWPKLRQLERQIVDEYRDALTIAFAHANAGRSLDTLYELCDSPEAIRGYEDIKHAAIDRWRGDVAALLSSLEQERASAA
jgi:indolepyruvate ferredoxin oxidoreductase